MKGRVITLAKGKTMHCDVCDKDVEEEKFNKHKAAHARWGNKSEKTERPPKKMLLGGVQDAKPEPAEPKKSDKDEFVDIYSVELKDIKGIGPAKASVLHSVGISNAIDLAVANPDAIAEDAEISRESVVEMIQAAKQLLQKHKFLEQDMLRGTELLKKREKVMYLKTGSRELDALLKGTNSPKGGIETMAVTEVYGEFGSSKTQLGFTFAVRAQLPIEEGGYNGGVLWIDTEGTFRPERIIEIAKNIDLDYEKTDLPMEKHRVGLGKDPLQSIILSKVYNASHFELLVKELSKYISQYKVKLIIIDSITNLHRKEFIGRGTLADRQGRLNSIMHMLVKIAEAHNIAVYITNQVMAKPEAYGGSFASPVGGNIIAHSSTYRISVRRSKGDVRIVTMVDSPSHPFSDCRIAIGPAGVVDETAEEKKKDKDEKLG